MVRPDGAVVRNPSLGCYYPVIRVEVFVTLGGQLDGIHFATVAWNKETASDGTTWYSGWFSPHNDTGSFHRADLIDFIDIQCVLTMTEMFVLRRASRENILKLGITNQAIKRPIGFRIP